MRRFWDKVDASGGELSCWPWLKNRSRQNYGKFYLNNKTIPAHRASWLLTKGEIPTGLFVLHRCDNPPCVNPAHLFLGTQLDNMQDKVLKGRAATGDRNGSRLHPELLARGEHHHSRTRPLSLAKGEGHGLSKLTTANVVSIRAIRASGFGSYQELADMFGVHHDTIRKVCIRQLWKHVA